MIGYILIKIKNKVLRKKGYESYAKYFRKKGMKIGNNTVILSDITTGESYLITIGDDVIISNNVQIITHDSSVGRFFNNATDIFGKVKIGNNCFIGARSIILPGVEIYDNNIIGAGSVVTKSFREEGKIIAGNPAKVIGSIEEYKQKVKNNLANITNLNKKEKYKYINNNVVYIEK